MPIETDALVLSLERRVEFLERLCGGKQTPRSAYKQYLQTYYEAKEGVVEYSEQGLALWCAVISSLDEMVLLQLSRFTEDPFPWRPFLLVLDGFTYQDFDARESTAHILELADTLFDLHGLSFLGVEDVLLADPLEGVMNDL